MRGEELISPGYDFSLGLTKPSLGVSDWEGGGRETALFHANPFLLSHQVFLIIHHAPLVNSLAEVILNGDLSETYPKPVQDVQRSSVSQ